MTIIPKADSGQAMLLYILYSIVLYNDVMNQRDINGYKILPCFQGRV